VEILTALKKLGEQLKPVEAEFLAVNTNAALSTFEKVSENIGMEWQCLIGVNMLVRLQMHTTLPAYMYVI